MFRTLDIIMIGALIAGATWTFKVKYDSEVAREELARLERRLQIEREAIDILKADWSLLTSPDRLEKLVTRYQEELLLAPAQPEQVGSFSEIPVRMPALDAEYGRSAGTVDRTTTTGSVAVPSARPPAETEPAEAAQ